MIIERTNQLKRLECSSHYNAVQIISRDVWVVPEPTWKEVDSASHPSPPDQNGPNPELKKPEIGSAGQGQQLSRPCWGERAKKPILPPRSQWTRLPWHVLYWKEPKWGRRRGWITFKLVYSLLPHTCVYCSHRPQSPHAHVQGILGSGPTTNN